MATSQSTSWSTLWMRPLCRDSQAANGRKLIRPPTRFLPWGVLPTQSTCVCPRSRNALWRIKQIATVSHRRSVSVTECFASSPALLHTAKQPEQRSIHSLPSSVHSQGKCTARQAIRLICATVAVVSSYIAAVIVTCQTSVGTFLLINCLGLGFRNYPSRLVMT